MNTILLPPEDLDILMSKGRQQLHDDLRRGWHVKSVIAIHSQARIKKAFDEAVPLHHPVFGQLTLVVDPVIYEEMRREHGEDCWRDPDFRRLMAKKNPEMDIRSKTKGTTVRIDGLRGPSRAAGNGSESLTSAPSVPVRASALDVQRST
ncbi:MAG TPA: hypothetical protein VGQ11_02720 [Candidatus Acidoferrales bacterium]|jgi:hypothetical protein|nr:hypothetical protein [Candidatus Acidoferrales bacterium]